MLAKTALILTIALALAGCSRQHNQPGASAAGTVQAANPTAPPSGQVAAGNPEPVDQLPPAAQSAANQSAQPLPASAAVSGNTAMNPYQAAAAAQPVSPPSSFQGSQPAAAEIQPAVVTIPARARIHVRLAETLDTRHSYAGERFVAHLSEPIVFGDRVVVPKGTAFQGHVIEAKPSGRWKGRAFLGVTLDSFRLRGVRYAVTTAPDFRSSRSHKRRDIEFVGGGSGTGATVGAVAGGGVGALVGAGAGAVAGTAGALFTGRKNVTLPVETPLVFSLRSDVTLHG